MKIHLNKDLILDVHSIEGAIALAQDYLEQLHPPNTSWEFGQIYDSQNIQIASVIKPYVYSPEESYHDWLSEKIQEYLFDT